MKKYKVNYDRPKPSSEEILSRRNFDGLMKQYQAAPGKVIQKPFWKSTWFFGTMATAAAVAAAVVIYVSRSDSGSNGTSPGIVQGSPDTRHPDSTGSNTPLMVQGKRTINPPLKGLNVAYSTYKMNAAKGGTITHSSGSKLTFPAGAFVDAKGNPVSGNVDIRYREFHDAVDIFVAGIPMQYDSAGVTHQFESAGMMEVAAFMDGKVVYLDKNKPVEVQLASSQSGTRFNVYEFDTAAGNWTYKGKDKVMPVEEPTQTPEQLAQQEEQRKEKLAQIEMQRDTAIAGVYNRNVVPAEPVRPLQANKSKNRFTVDFDPREFPEMSAYRSVMFEVDESREKFDPAMYKTSWEDMKLSKGESADRYVLTFKKGLKVVKLDVYPVFEGQSYESAMKTFQEKYDQYNAALAKRNREELAARKRYDEMVEKQGIVGAVQEIQKKKMDVDNSVTGDVMRVFTISGFGVFNCDCPGSYPQGAKPEVTFTDDHRAPIDGLVSSYLVDRSVFGLFNFNGNHVKEFSFNPEHSNLVWGVKDGVLYAADNDQFENLPETGTGMVTMKPVTETFTSPEEMKAYFHISSRNYK